MVTPPAASLVFDTHAHFDAFGMPDEVDAVVARARAAGVARLIAVGGSPEANARALAVAGRYPLAIRAAAGYDRYRAAESDAPGPLGAHLASPLAAAVGEIGLDYHYEPGTAAAQRRLFDAMLALAVATRKPVIVHSREADGDTLDALRRHAAAWPGEPDRVGVLHCFTGGWDFAHALLDLGFMISFSGIVSFRNAQPLRDVAAQVPEDRLLVETDTPYLAPVPMRGRRNEPAFLPHVVAAVAAARRDAPEGIAALTARNAARLFDFGGDTWPR
jgi:TatD DNase family protein